MSKRADRLVLGLTLNPFGGQGSWRRSTSQAEVAHTFDAYHVPARLAEEAKLHFVFIADGPTHDSERFPVNPFRVLEGLTVVAALAGTTRDVGLVTSLSTTFSEPFNVARQLASLDHLSGGRAGWNVVTSFGGAEHFGEGVLPAHSARYARAEEFLEVVDLFWRSWDEGALVIDRERGIWGDPTAVHEETFAGDSFHIRGPLNLPASPQGRPLITQAGASDRGRDLGARHADLVLNLTASSDEAIAFYRDVKRRASAAGRDPDKLKVVPVVVPIVGESEADAEQIDRELAGLVDFESGRRSLEWLIGDVDLSPYSLDEPIPPEIYPQPTVTNRVQSHIDNLRHRVLVERHTIRQLILAATQTGAGWKVVGDVEQVADALQTRFEQHGADGYVLAPAYAPEGYRAITERLVPELQARGVFQREYEHATLRRNVGVDHDH